MTTKTATRVESAPATPDGTAAVDQSPLPTRAGKATRWAAAIGHRYARTIPLAPDERRAVIATLFHEGSRARPHLRRFGTLSALSVAIAVFGILADSTAVIVGAMLVAPLIGPVLAVSAAVVMGWPRRVLRNLALIAVSSAACVGLAALISYFIPHGTGPLPKELLARTSPNLLDLGIALAAGAAGAYAMVRRQSADALAGAAVAVALVPPLAVVGISLQLGEAAMAGGALLLFLINGAGITFSGAVTFLVAGLAPGERLLSAGVRIGAGLRWAAVAVIVVAVPIHLARAQLLPVPQQEEAIAQTVDEWADEDRLPIELVEVSIDVESGVAEIDLVLASPQIAPPLDDLADDIAEELDRPVKLDVQVISSERRHVRTDVQTDDSDG